MDCPIRTVFTKPESYHIQIELAAAAIPTMVLFAGFYTGFAS